MFGRLYVVALTLALASGYRSFLDEIPNSRVVPNPCRGEEKLWEGVGHMALLGGGARNQFGKDFKEAGYSWRDVCPLDSDGDGLTNGQELGDPLCQWTKGTAVNTTQAISHPGFCDPLEAAHCISNPHKPRCEDQTFSCPAVDDPEVIKWTLQYPRTNVPTTETNYFCMTFDIDDSQDYHVIATQPAIDNVDVMHHMLLYGCTGEAEQMTTPAECGMAMRNCNDVIGGWTVGLAGECLYKEAGFRVGKSGYRRIVLQFHWNNPGGRTDYYDSSGMTIYYTPKLRKYDAGVFWTGETNLVIPPGRSRVVFDSECPSFCTNKMLNDTIYFTQGINHMHYRGTHMSVMKESGRNVTELTNDPGYDYDSPRKYEYDPPIPVKPGDRLLTTCIFQSLKDTETIYFGDATNDEMCYGFFTYFPKANAKSSFCDSSGTYQNCRRTEDGYYGSCNMKTFFNSSHPETKMLMEKVIFGCESGLCDKQCEAAIEEAQTHPCLIHENREWALRFYSYYSGEITQRFVAGMRACETKMPSSAVSSSAAVVSVFILAAVAICHTIII